MGVRVEAVDLWKSFDGGLVRALSGTSLTVAEGEHVAIMGPTGSGKSTLLSIIALLDAPDSGSLLLDGKPARSYKAPEDWRAEHVGIVFQFHHLLPHLTVAENVRLPLVGRSREGERKTAALLEEIGLTHRARTLAANISGGERQMAAVARALVNAPSLVLADEPTGSVDSATGERILDVLRSYCGRTGATLLVVTHDSGVAAHAERIVRLRDGRNVTPDDAPVSA